MLILLVLCVTFGYHKLWYKLRIKRSWVLIKGANSSGRFFARFSPIYSVTELLGS